MAFLRRKLPRTSQFSQRRSSLLYEVLLASPLRPFACMCRMTHRRTHSCSDGGHRCRLLAITFHHYLPMCVSFHAAKLFLEFAVAALVRFVSVACTAVTSGRTSIVGRPSRISPAMRRLNGGPVRWCKETRQARDGSFDVFLTSR